MLAWHQSCGYLPSYRSSLSLG